jgi:endonuclease/exonuclease/phosphatase family metal-dependent hydrolase
VAAAGARRYWLIWLGVVPVVLWAIVRSLGLEGDTVLVPLIAFTPYALIVAFFVAGIAVALRNWAAATVAAIATLCLAAAVLPRAVGDGTVDPAGRETLAVVSANIHRGTADPAALVALVDRFQPDLFAVQELTPGFVRELAAAGLERRLPHHILVVFPGSPKRPGVGIYSRLPLDQLGPSSTDFVGAAVRMPGGRLVRVMDFHPHTPKPGHIGQWRHSLEGLPSAGSGAPWVVVGDFNATLDQVELRDVIDRGYRDAGDVAGKGLEMTFPRRGWHDLGPFIAIDHVLADERLGIAEYSVAEQPGSDHRAIQAVLVLP